MSNSTAMKIPVGKTPATFDGKNGLERGYIDGYLWIPVANKLAVVFISADHRIRLVDHNKLTAEI
jgi:hypothetical protein